LPTWTPAALAPELRRLAGVCWRVVEAQHVISTMPLVDTLEEQALLEEIIDASKPAIPADCDGLHYLLSTPFRYGSPYPHGSRFRRAGFTPGVFYASQECDVAVAEMTFHRLLFYAESPGTPWPANAAEYTAFSVRYATGKGLDLTLPPLQKDERRWRDPVDFAASQALADAARAAGAQALRYASARTEGRNVALLTCAAFRSREPIERQRWRIHLDASGARAICDFPERRLAFDRNFFTPDPRFASAKG
jgi:hypothetical protein